MERAIDPAAIVKANDLELVARCVANGFMQGVHDSYHRGVGIEFSQYRAYERGDDPARIDWKLFARSDRYFVREAERESEVSIWFVLDGSRSMLQRSEGGAWSKFDYARHLLATLAYIAQGQGDRVGLLTVAEGTTLLPALPGQRQWHRILGTLQAIKPQGVFPEATGLQAQLHRLRGAGLVFFISDFYESHDELQMALEQSATSRNETVALQLKCGDELNFGYQGLIRFEDLETGEQVLASGARAQQRFNANHEAQQIRLLQQLGRINITLDTFNIDEPLDAAVRQFLARRRSYIDR